MIVRSKSAHQCRFYGFFLPVLLCLSLLGILLPSKGYTADVLVLGDSISAEYAFADTVDPVFSIDSYRPYSDGKLAKTWVEIIAESNRSGMRFGDYNDGFFDIFDNYWPGWEYNYAIPGSTVSGYIDFLENGAGALSTKNQLDSDLDDAIERVVVFYGANDIDYSEFARGTLPDEDWLDNFEDEFNELLGIVNGNPARDLQVVVCTIIDQGITPERRNDYTLAERETAAAGIALVNERIVRQAERLGFAIADMYAFSRRIASGEPLAFGNFPIIVDSYFDNDMGLTGDNFLVCEDEFHPNTPGQILIAREIIQAFNDNYNANIPQIDDAEALEILDVNTSNELDQYLAWAASQGLVSAPVDGTPARDGVTNLEKFTFGIDDVFESGVGELPMPEIGPARGQTQPDNTHFRYQYWIDAQAVGNVRVTPRYRTDLSDDVPWTRVPNAWISVPAPYTYLITVPLGDFEHIFFDLDIVLNE